MDLRNVVFLFIFLVCLSPSSFSATRNLKSPTSISTSSLQNFSKNSNAVKKIITLSLKLANRNLRYLYGSADPKRGGMDCSGTINYLLTSYGIKGVPRSSDSLYKWVGKKGHFHAVHSNKMSSFGFYRLKPGDLLFWSGTYKTSRKLASSHVMLYLGKDKNGKRLMVGASNGRTYLGRKIYGVSVFDFVLPGGRSSSKFLGYSCIPQVNC